MLWPKTGAACFHAQLILLDKGHASKGFVVYNSSFVNTVKGQCCIDQGLVIGFSLLLKYLIRYQFSG